MAKDNFDGALDRLTKSKKDKLKDSEAQKEQERIEKYITAWRTRVTRAKEHDEKYYKRWADDRKVAKGDTKHDIKVNLIASIAEIMLAFLYAKDPDMNVRPSKSVNSPPSTDPQVIAEQAKKIEQYRGFAKTIEIMISRMHKDAYLKKVAKRWIRGSYSVGIGWLKSAMQRRVERDPVMEASINDLTQQVERIRAKQAMIEDHEGDPDILIQELEDNMAAAEEQLEIIVAEGLVIDYMYPEDVVVAPECGDVENYLLAPWIAFESYKSEEDVLAITQWEGDEVTYLKSANRWSQRPRTGNPKESGEGYMAINDLKGKAKKEAESAEGFFQVVEVWSLADGNVYTYIDGCTKAWARDPYPPVTGKRFYPIFQLAFHYIDSERYPQSDTFMLKDLQNEYLEVRSDFRKHRKRARPGTIFDETRITKESIRKLTGADTAEFIGIEMIDPSMPVKDAIAAKFYNPIDPGLYDTSGIIREMERIGGVQEALQQGAQVEKTATEARIQESGFGMRTGARRDQLEDVLTELCEYNTQLALLTMDQDDAERYAGPEAIWISLSTDEALAHFDITIKAGSTGKPEANSDRDAWSTIMPLLLDLIDKIGAARLQDQEWAAKPFVALVKETLERLDDHADINEFLPVPPPEAIAAAGSNEPTEEEKAATELDRAKKMSELADAIEKIPTLLALPEVQELLGILKQPGQELPQGALDQPAQPPAPPPI